MRAHEVCDLPYIWCGDIRHCRLPANHEGDCPDANRAATLAQLYRDRDGWVF